MGSQIMSAHILNKTLLMEFLKSAKKKKKKNHKSCWQEVETGGIHFGEKKM